jgi:hypothetical protein
VEQVAAWLAAEVVAELPGAVVGVHHHLDRAGAVERFDGQVHQRPARRCEQRLRQLAGERAEAGARPRRQAEPDRPPQRRSTRATQ